MQISKIHLRKVKGIADKYGDKGTKDGWPRMCVSSYRTEPCLLCQIHCPWPGVGLCQCLLNECHPGCHRTRVCKTVVDHSLWLLLQQHREMSQGEVKKKKKKSTSFRYGLLKKNVLTKKAMINILVM